MEKICKNCDYFIEYKNEDFGKCSHPQITECDNPEFPENPLLVYGADDTYALNLKVHKTFGCILFEHTE